MCNAVITVTPPLAVSNKLYTAKNSVAHEATQSVAKMLIHISVALSATVVWLTFSDIKCGY